MDENSQDGNDGYDGDVCREEEEDRYRVLLAHLEYIFPDLDPSRLKLFARTNASVADEGEMGARMEELFMEQEERREQMRVGYRIHTHRLTRLYHDDDPTELHARAAEGFFLKTVVAASTTFLPAGISRWPKEEEPKIRSIDVVVNEGLKAAFASKKEALRSAGKPHEERLLFHGTSFNNVDSILRENFDLARAARTAYGVGVYLSEFPLTCLRYGPGLILCRVLPGLLQTEGSTLVGEAFDSFCVNRKTHTGAGGGSGSKDYIYVIKDPSQILPYCVINLDRSFAGMTTTSTRSATTFAITTPTTPMSAAVSPSTSPSPVTTLFLPSETKSKNAPVAASGRRCPVCRRASERLVFGFTESSAFCPDCSDFFARAILGDGSNSNNNNPACTVGGRGFSCGINAILTCHGCRLGRCLDKGMSVRMLCKVLGLDERARSVAEKMINRFAATRPARSSTSSPQQDSKIFSLTPVVQCQVCHDLQSSATMSTTYGPSACRTCTDEFVDAISGIVTASSSLSPSLPVCVIGSYSCRDLTSCRGCLVRRCLTAGMICSRVCDRKRLSSFARHRIQSSFRSATNNCPSCGIVSGVIVDDIRDLLIDRHGAAVCRHCNDRFASACNSTIAPKCKTGLFDCRDVRSCPGCLFDRCLEAGLEVERVFVSATCFAGTTGMSMFMYRRWKANAFKDADGGNGNSSPALPSSSQTSSSSDKGIKDIKKEHDTKG